MVLDLGDGLTVDVTKVGEEEMLIFVSEDDFVTLNKKQLTNFLAFILRVGKIPIKEEK